MLSVEQFREEYSPFFPESVFSDSLAQRQIDNGYAELNKSVWGDRQDYGVGLYTAHFLECIRSALLSSQGSGSGASPSVGVDSARQVDVVQKTIDTTISAYEGAGIWNQTLWGRELYRLIRIYGCAPRVAGLGYGWRGLNEFYF